MLTRFQASKEDIVPNNNGGIGKLGGVIIPIP